MKLLLLSLICAFGAMARLTNRAPADMVEDEADGIAIRAILRNIHPPGSLPGVVVSSQSRTSPNYYFHWVRDAAITMNNFVHYYSQGQFYYESMIWDYVNFTRTIQNLPMHEGLGNTKFNVDGTAYELPWCRPQTDGAALSASVMIRFAKAYLAEGGLLERVQTELFDDNAPSRTAIKRALDFVAENWQNTDTCDIWEEVHGDHFYTRMIQRRAMMEGQEFAMLMKDLKSADKYAAQVHQLTEALDGHWDERQSVILSARSSSRPNRSGLDSSVLFGVNHADEESGGSIESFAPNDPRILATVPKMVESFSRLYPISKIRQNTAGLSLGPAIGRYPEDTYDGTGSSRGNPWFVCTVGLAEYYYRLISLYRNKGSVTVNTLNLVFFNFLGIWNVEPDNTYGSETPQFETIVNTLSVRGDEILRRVQYHSMDGAMSEQFNRIYGFMQGATNVTWTYASLLSANRARLRA